jgi:hypothetical protein
MGDICFGTARDLPNPWPGTSIDVLCGVIAMHPVRSFILSMIRADKEFDIMKSISM